MKLQISVHEGATEMFYETDCFKFKKRDNHSKSKTHTHLLALGWLKAGCRGCTRLPDLPLPFSACLLQISLSLPEWECFSDDGKSPSPFIFGVVGRAAREFQRDRVSGSHSKIIRGSFNLWFGPCRLSQSTWSFFSTSFFLEKNSNKSLQMSGKQPIDNFCVHWVVESADSRKKWRWLRRCWWWSLLLIYQLIWFLLFPGISEINKLIIKEYH